MKYKYKALTLSLALLLSINFSTNTYAFALSNNCKTNTESNIISDNNIKEIYTESELKKFLIENFLQRKEVFSCIAYNSDVIFNIKLLESTIRTINKENKLIESMIKISSFQSTEYPDKSEFKITVDYQSSSAEFEELDSFIDELLPKIITKDMFDYEKVSAVHDYIVKTYEYDEEYENYSAYKLYSEGKGVCQAYTLMMYYMLDKLDIPVKVVDGYVNNDENARHSWNLVNLGGYWFHIDATWDDPIPNVADHAYHNYFCLTDSEIEKDHTILGKEFLPICDKNYQEYISELLANKDELIRERTTDYINVKIHDSYVDFAAIEENTDRKAVFPIVENSRTLVPIRSIAQSLNYNVTWNQEEATAYLTKNDIVIKIKPDSLFINVNGKIKALDVPARVINNRILIPIRAISESLGYIVYWQAETKDILIY